VAEVFLIEYLGSLVVLPENWDIDVRRGDPPIIIILTLGESEGEGSQRRSYWNYSIVVGAGRPL